MSESIGYYPEAELVFGIICPLGVSYRSLLDSLQLYLQQFGYSYHEVKLSGEFEDLAVKLGIEVADEQTRVGQMWRKIELGNEIRRRTARSDILALVAAASIEATRPEDREPMALPKTAHVIVSLKRPEEVATLRRLYGTGFFLIGIAPAESHRKTYFDEMGLDKDERARLIETDADEEQLFGQRTRDTFYLSDVFISLHESSKQIARFLDLVFGYPFHTPNLDERSMYLAYAASLTSGDLARQVGAAMVDMHGDTLSVGWNDVPKAGGGLYGPGMSEERDMDRGQDSNDEEKLAMAHKILRRTGADEPTIADPKAVRMALKGTGFFDITEFGRAVHAEMEAILACARSGRSPRGASLYVTTFPCHNCTRHVIAAGIAKVYYIEPYAKSKALQLHGDAITDQEGPSDGGRKIPFLSFIGIGPRRYLDLFSLSLGTGYPIERKVDGKKVAWLRAKATPRLQMPAVSYLIRERVASSTLDNLISRNRVNDHDRPKPIEES
jgi:deoxycytidylate deaminase